MRKLLYVLVFGSLLCSCGRQSGNRNSSNLPPDGGGEYDYFMNVIKISDGDTFTGLTQEKIEIRFRIYGIDAPEKKQPYSNQSQKYLSDLIYGKRVGIKVQKKNDGFGRPVVWVFTPDGKDVSAEMLKAGMAWHFKKYDKSLEYAELENNAKENRVGLWADKSPTAPWDYRKSKKK